MITKVPDTILDITLEVYDASTGLNKDEGEGWVEVTFQVPLSFHPDEYYSCGVPAHWYIDGFITDDVGYIFDNNDIDEMYNDWQDETSGFDWESLFQRANQEAYENFCNAKIDDYEAMKEAY